MMLIAFCPVFADNKINQAAVDRFEKRVRPILVKHCYECHGPDTDKGEASLRLDTLAGVLKGGESGPGVVPGKPFESLLIHAVTHDPAVAAMPPGKRLSNDEIATLTRWVLIKPPWPVAGVAHRPRRPTTKEFHISKEDRHFWAFVPPRRPKTPQVRNGLSLQNPIDRFVVSQLEKTGIKSARPADKQTLIRRTTFDLHGLPPTRDEVAAFVNDASPNAFLRVIDRLLASPRYGEKWGRHWLDVARYSDSNGMDDNIAFAEAWRYRDYVIAAFNKDKPYDQFVREQVAGDLLVSWKSPNRSESVIATTFLMLGQKQPSADDPVKQELDIVDEQLDTITRTFLAVTVTCARCHDHKFDPFSQRDYYALAGIFRSTTSMLSFRVDAKFNLTALSNAGDDQRLSQLELEMDEHDDILVNGNRIDMSVDARKSHTDKLNKVFDEIATIPTAMAVKEGTISDMSLLLRGNHLTPSHKVERGVPLILSRDESISVTDGESGRRELAQWLSSPANPLTARVIVNRIWHWHMGQGLVASVDNFGRLGQRPRNPELLDWLAAQFIESGWSIKEMHRTIMTSHVYQASSQADASALKKDPENTLFSYMAPRRLQAEEIRDSLLWLAGLLDLEMGGKTLPIRNHKIMNTVEINKCNAVHQQLRRTVYLPVIRSGLEEFLATFDFPDPSVPAGKRNSTIVAPQALYMMNSSLVATSSRKIARRVFAQAAADNPSRIRYAYKLMLQRVPTDEDIQQWETFLEQRAAIEDASNVSDTKMAPWESMVRVLLSSNDFMYVK
jgi:cytochrome c553